MSNICCPIFTHPADDRQKKGVAKLIGWNSWTRKHFRFDNCPIGDGTET